MTFTHCPINNLAKKQVKITGILLAKHWKTPSFAFGGLEDN
jgi:hypothetical protein